MPLDPTLVYGFRPTQNVGPNMGEALQNYSQILGLQQQQKGMQSQNALRDILGAPGAIGADGNPTQNAMGQLAGANPDAWLKLRETQLSMQRQQAQMQEYQTKRQEEIQGLIDPTRAAALKAYTDTDGPPEAKMAAGQKVLSDGLDDLVRSGAVSDEEKPRLNRTFDPARMSMMSDRWQQLLKEKAAAAEKQRTYDLDLKKADQTERHETNQDEIARNKPIPMTDPGNKDAEGNAFPYLLNTVTREATTLDGKPYAPKGMQRVGTTSNAPLATTPDELTSMGAQASTGQPLNQIAPGYGQQASALRKQVHDAAIKKIEDDTGMNASDAGIELANRSIAFVAGGKTTGQLTEMQGATRQAVGQLDFNIGKVTEEMGKLKSSNLSPIINAIIRKDQQWTGDPAYAGLFLYMNAVATESARIMSGGQASRAQLQVGAAQEAQKWANANMTPNMWAEVSKAMHDEGLNRVQTYGDAIRQQRVGTGAAGAQGGQSGGSTTGGGGQAPPPAGTGQGGAGTDSFYRGDTPPADHPNAQRSPKDGKWYFQQDGRWYGAAATTATAAPAKATTPTAGQQGAQPVKSNAPGKTRQDPVSVTTPDEAMKLPPGTYFIGPDKKLRQRPAAATN